MEPEQLPVVAQPAHVLGNQQLGQPVIASAGLTKGDQGAGVRGLLPPKPGHPDAHISCPLFLLVLLSAKARLVSPSIPPSPPGFWQLVFQP